LPIAALLQKTALDRIHLTYLPSAEDLASLNDQVFARHPQLALRFYQLPDGTDFERLAHLTRLEQLSIECELNSLEFVTGLAALRQLHIGLKRRLKAPRIDWPNSLRHLSISADVLDSISGLAALRSINLAAKVNDLSFLGHIPTLASLSLDGCSSGDFSRLSPCKALRHVRVNGQRAVETAHLNGLTQLESLEFLQLHDLPRLDDINQLAYGVLHLELVSLKGLQRIDWSSLSSLRSLALLPARSPLRELDLRALPKSLDLVCFGPRLVAAKGGPEALAAFAARKSDLYILDFRAAVAERMTLDCPYL